MRVRGGCGHGISMAVPWREGRTCGAHHRGEPFREGAAGAWPARRHSRPAVDPVSCYFSGRRPHGGRAPPLFSAATGTVRARRTLPRPPPCSPRTSGAPSAQVVMSMVVRPAPLFGKRLTSVTSPSHRLKRNIYPGFSELRRRPNQGADHGKRLLTSSVVSRKLSSSCAMDVPSEAARGTCPVCKTSRALCRDGTVREHWQTGTSHRCMGSRWAPDPSDRPTATTVAR